MDHSITGLIDCPSARHAAADTRRPTYESADERDARDLGSLRAAGQAAAAGRGEEPSECGQLRTRSGMSTTSPARLIALLTLSAHARPHFVGAVPPNRAQIC